MSTHGLPERLSIGNGDCREHPGLGKWHTMPVHVATSNNLKNLGNSMLTVHLGGEGGTLYDEQSVKAFARAICERYNAHEELKAGLEQIAACGGNLSDEVIESIGGVNDGKSRAIMYTTARTIARALLAQLNKERK